MDIANQTADTAFGPRKFLRGIGVRQVRLAAGLILFGYVTEHYICHALGNISLEAMEFGLWFHMAFWRSPVGTLLLYPALAVHAFLGLWALYQRRHFKWKTTEFIQLVFGLSIPALLCGHLIGQRLGANMYGLEKSYAQYLYALIFVRPDFFVMQITLMLVVWTHACIGLGIWLRLQPSFPRMAPFLLTGAILLPTLALLGVYRQRRSAVRVAEQQEFVARVRSPTRVGTPAQRATLETIRDYFLLSYAGMIGLV